MPTRKQLPLVLSALVLVALLALPAAAQATLTYVRNPFHPTVFVANDDGSGAKKIEAGELPRVSPDGNWVAYLHTGAKNAQELKVAPVAGGPSRTLMTNFREPFYLEWSPDSKLIAAQRGPELGKRHLVAVDVATGSQRVVATGYFSGFSFAPFPTDIEYPFEQLVYAKAGSEKFPPRSDLFRTEVPSPGVVNVQAPRTYRLTSDHRSSYPLWGPKGRIVFVKTLDANKRKYGPKNELYLMDLSGLEGIKRLTHTNVPALAQGLFPTDWSASGNQLLTEFEGQDISYAVKVNPKTGGQKPVGKAGEQGFVGTALSSDGKFVLGFEGGFDPGNSHNVVRIPYKGGKPKLLAKNAFEPDWSF
jgi:dipeptidyl aminopeptidase/acylaminoacyl peptidase